MSDDEDVSVPPTRVCEELINKFVAVTDTDEALAQMRLQQNEWNLERALEDHFGGLAPPALQLKASGVEASTKAPEKLLLVSWNIDGLSEKNLIERTNAVCDLIEEHKINVVFLQEVIPLTLEIIKEKLFMYECIYDDTYSYFNVILFRRFTIYLDKYEIVSFPDSRMGRSAILARAHVGKAKLVFLNTHLESTKDYKEERIKQLTKCFKTVLECKEDESVVFGGDLNLRDKEIESLGGPPSGVEDLWEATGCREECKYTWDLTRNTNLEFPGRFKPRLRFDRLYSRDASQRQLKVEHFGLFGIERVPGTQSFPSDHWAVLAAFKIRSN